jgi:uncharacterized protein
MAAPRINALLICGGKYHDMDFARLELLKLLGEHEQIRTTVRDDYAASDDFARARFLITYTCNVVPSEAQRPAVEQFLASGGRWLALHGTNSVLRYLQGRGWDAPGDVQPFMQILGSQFIAHPAIAPYRVEVSDAKHPLVAGLAPFETDDELYLCRYFGENHALLHTQFSGRAPGFVTEDWGSGDGRHLVMYLHRHGEGEVLYCTLGHCRGRYDMQPMMEEYPNVERGSWQLPVFHELLRRGIRWAARLDG